ncbi:MAG: hypothetical protein Q9166_006192 [cf. Caloplaca sp. 2 TL-2023]
MRARRWITVANVSLLARQSLAHFSLTELQPIAGFSDACTQAYATPLTDCTTTDFYKGSTCSPKCIAFLEAMTTLLNDECRGTTAFPNTLIGMFFGKTAVEQLCPGVEVTTISAGGADQGSEASETATAESTSLSSSSQTTSTIVKTATMTATSTASAAAASTTSSIQTSNSVTSSTIASGIDLGGASSATVIQTNTASASAPTSSAAQSSPTGTDQDSSGGGGGNNNGNGGTVLDEAASRGNAKSVHNLVSRDLPDNLEISSMAERSSSRSASNSTDVAALDSATTTDLNTIENALNTEQTHFFSSLVRILHLPPIVANAASSVYRAALSSNAMVCCQAESAGFDAAWLWAGYCIVGYVALSLAELGMSFLEHLIGMVKGVLWIPIVGILLRKLGKKKSLREIIDFLSESRKDEGEKEIEVEVEDTTES